MTTLALEIQSLNLCELSEVTRGDGFGNVRQSSEAIGTSTSSLVRTLGDFSDK